MHCNLRPPDSAPVVLCCNHDAHTNVERSGVTKVGVTGCGKNGVTLFTSKVMTFLVIVLYTVTTRAPLRLSS